MAKYRIWLSRRIALQRDLVNLVLGRAGIEGNEVLIGAATWRARRRQRRSGRLGAIWLRGHGSLSAALWSSTDDGKWHQRPSAGEKGRCSRRCTMRRLRALWRWR